MMSRASDQLDALMEKASLALARGDYLDCEASSLQALDAARAAGDWSYYARILLPLQESRRHRRMIAAEGRVRLGCSELTGSPIDWLKDVSCSCVVLTRPHNIDAARAIESHVRREQLYVEVLFADSPSSADSWKLRAFDRPQTQVELPAPPVAWRERWLGGASNAGAPPDHPSLRPGDWVIDASEALGDAALAQMTTGDRDELAHLDELESCLRVFADHEIIHQRLGNAARRMAHRTCG